MAGPLGFSPGPQLRGKAGIGSSLFVGSHNRLPFFVSFYFHLYLEHLIKHLMPELIFTFAGRRSGACCVSPQYKLLSLQPHLLQYICKQNR